MQDRSDEIDRLVIQVRSGPESHSMVAIALLCVTMFLVRNITYE